MTIENDNLALSQKMATQLRVRGETLEDVAAKAGRKLPKRLQKHVDVLTEAAAAEKHPKLMRQIDPREVRKSRRRLTYFLDKQDPKSERRGEILDVIAKIAFVVVTVLLAVFFLLLWRGYL